MFGLLDRDMEYIHKALGKFKEIDRAVIFGSRSMGNYKKGSDVDIAISGQSITKETLYRLDDLLNEEYPLPYFFDLLHYEEINNVNLINHIDSFGIELYNKTESKNISSVTNDMKEI
jgi:predicted nucleotidyltransferase